jgi:hypothetical protein
LDVLSLLLPALLGALSASPAPAATGARFCRQDLVRPTVEEDVESLAFVETECDGREFFVQQAVPVTLRVGIDREFLEQHALQPFLRPLDVPLQVAAPWLWTPGTPDDAAPDAGATFALDDGVVAGTLGSATREGRSFVVVELERPLFFSEPGERVLTGPLVRLAYTTRFETDAFGARAATDRHDVVLRGEPLTLTVRELPFEGQPIEFTGAVGRFTLDASVTPRHARPDETVALELVVEGDGDLAAFAPPRVAPRGFDVRGMLDRVAGTRRTLVFELAPQRSGVQTIAPIPFAYFDPAPPAGYRTLATPELSVTVAAREEDARPTGAEDALEPSGGMDSFLVAGLALLAAAGVLAVVFARRGRARSKGGARRT